MSVRMNQRPPNSGLNHSSAAFNMGLHHLPHTHPAALMVSNYHTHGHHFHMAAAAAASMASMAASNMNNPASSSTPSTPLGSGIVSSSTCSSGSSGNSSGATLNSSSSPEDNNRLTASEAVGGEPRTMTRSSQYKKIMKPLLERKRRARINKCLDELKDIMTAALQAQGENVSKLEKADILELTVRHLHKMQQARRLMSSASRNPLEEIHRFQAGYSSCAQEAASFLLSTPGVDISVGQRLMAHLTSNIANPVASAVHSRLTPTHQPLPPAHMATSTPTNPYRNNSSSDEQGQQQPPRSFSRSFPQRRSSASPNLSPSKRLFHSPPLGSSSAYSPPPPRPASTPANNNNKPDYSLLVTLTSASALTLTSEDDESGDDVPRIPLKPSPIRLNPNDPVWRPF